MAVTSCVRLMRQDSYLVDCSVPTLYFIFVVLIFVFLSKLDCWRFFLFARVQFFDYQCLWGAGIALLVARRTRDRKVESSNPGRGGGSIFFSRVNFVCWLSFGVLSTPMLPQWHVKDPGHSAKGVGGRLQPNTHTSFDATKFEWVDYAVQA